MVNIATGGRTNPRTLHDPIPEPSQLSSPRTCTVVSTESSVQTLNPQSSRRTLSPDAEPSVQSQNPQSSRWRSPVPGHRRWKFWPQNFKIGLTPARTKPFWGYLEKRRVIYPKNSSRLRIIFSENLILTSIYSTLRLAITTVKIYFLQIYPPTRFILR